ncbi:MAG: hypothetical protein K0R75_849 [Paenibacillaceae bacterium]|jgi:AraC-like DNA-binding protein|nr:hypothetical protein [Paenibacillaceae bacterium]
MQNELVQTPESGKEALGLGHIRHVGFLKDLSLRFNWIIEWKFKPEEELGQVAFPHTLIWLVLGGRRTITFKERTWEIRRGDLVIIPPHVMRDVQACPGERELFHYITVSCDIRVEPLEFTDLYRFPNVIPNVEPTEFAAIVECSHHLLKITDDILFRLDLRPIPARIKHVPTHEVDVDETSALLEVDGMFRLWFSRFFRLIRPTLPDQPMFVDPRIQKVCVYILNNLAHTVKISDLARQVFTSESHLRMLFRKTLGISPMDYLQQERMRRTKELLLNTEYSIKEISEKTGFANQNIFSRAFVNLEGISPREYRKRLREHHGHY